MRTLIVVSFFIAWTRAEASAQDACVGDAQVSATTMVEDLYSAARAAYEAGDHRGAAIRFRQIAFDHADHASGEHAASLYLDSLNRLFQAGNAACAESIAAAIDPLRTRYCGASSRHDDLCRTLAQLYCDSTRLRTEALVRERRYREAHDQLVRLAREHPECGRADELLYNAALYAQAARQPSRAFTALETLVRNHRESALAKLAVFLLGAGHHALAEYAEAASWYERFAREYPGEDGSWCSEEQQRTATCPHARRALENAIFFRLGLGEIDAALDDARTYERNYARRDPVQSARVALAMLEALERTERWRELVRESERALGAYANAPPEVLLRVRLLAALGHRGLGRARSAEPHLAAIVSAWRAGVLERMPGSSDSPDAALGLARAKDVIARAIFLRSDDASAELLASRLQVPGRDVARWEAQTFTPWLSAQERALDEVRSELERVAELEIPEWQIAAAERIGSIDAHIGDQIAAVIEALPESARAALEASVARLRRRALDHYGYCATVAVRVRWPSAVSHRCNEELSRLDPIAHPIGPFELLGDPAIDAQPAHPSPVREDDVELPPDSVFPASSQ